VAYGTPSRIVIPSLDWPTTTLLRSRPEATSGGPPFPTAGRQGAPEGSRLAENSSAICLRATSLDASMSVRARSPFAIRENFAISAASFFVSPLPPLDVAM